jgi:hypothetical protein
VYNPINSNKSIVNGCFNLHHSRLGWPFSCKQASICCLKFRVWGFTLLKIWNTTYMCQCPLTLSDMILHSVHHVVHNLWSASHCLYSIWKYTKQFFWKLTFTTSDCDYLRNATIIVDKDMKIFICVYCLCKKNSKMKINENQKKGCDKAMDFEGNLFKLKLYPPLRNVMNGCISCKGWKHSKI